jgi:hypothetical protein
VCQSVNNELFSIATALLLFGSDFDLGNCARTIRF